MKVVAASALVGAAAAIGNIEVGSPFIELLERQTSRNVDSNVALAHCLKGPHYDEQTHGIMYDFQDENGSYVDIRTENVHSTIRYKRGSRELSCRHTTYDHINGPRVYVKTFQNVDFLNLRNKGCMVRKTTVNDLLNFFFPGPERLNGITFFSSLNGDVKLDATVLGSYCPKTAQETFAMTVNQQTFKIVFPSYHYDHFVSRPTFMAQINPNVHNLQPTTISALSISGVAGDDFWPTDANPSAMPFPAWSTPTEEDLHVNFSTSKALKLPSEGVVAFTNSGVHRYEVSMEGFPLNEVITGLFSSKKAAQGVQALFRDAVGSTSKAQMKYFDGKQSLFSVREFIPVPAKFDEKDKLYEMPAYRIALMPHAVEGEKYDAPPEMARFELFVEYKAAGVPPQCKVRQVDADGVPTSGTFTADVDSCGLSDHLFGFLSDAHVFDTDELIEAASAEEFASVASRLAAETSSALPLENLPMMEIKELCVDAVGDIKIRLQDLFKLMKSQVTAFELDLAVGFSKELKAKGAAAAVKELPIVLEGLRISSYYTIGSALGKVLGQSLTAQQLYNSLQGYTKYADADDTNFTPTCENRRVASEAALVLRDIQEEYDGIAKPFQQQVNAILPEVSKFFSHALPFVSERLAQAKNGIRENMDKTSALLDAQGLWDLEAAEPVNEPLTSVQMDLLLDGMDVVAHVDEVLSSVNTRMLATAIVNFMEGIVPHYNREMHQGGRGLSGLDVNMAKKLIADSKEMSEEVDRFDREYPVLESYFRSASHYQQTVADLEKVMRVVEEHISDFDNLPPIRVTREAYVDSLHKFVYETQLPNPGESPEVIRNALETIANFLDQWEEVFVLFNHAYYMNHFFVNGLMARRMADKQVVPPALEEKRKQLTEKMDTALQTVVERVQYMREEKGTRPDDYYPPSGDGVLKNSVSLFAEFEQKVAAPQATEDMALLRSAYLAEQFLSNYRSLTSDGKKPSSADMNLSAGPFRMQLDEFQAATPDRLVQYEEAVDKLKYNAEQVASIFDSHSADFGALNLGLVASKASADLARKAVAEVLDPHLTQLSAAKVKESAQVQEEEIRNFLLGSPEDYKMISDQLVTIVSEALDAFHKANLATEHLLPAKVLHSKEAEKFHLQKKDNLRDIAFRADGVYMEAGYALNLVNKAKEEYDEKAAAYPQKAALAPLDSMLKNMQESLKKTRDAALKEASLWHAAAQKIDKLPTDPETWVGIAELKRANVLPTVKSKPKPAPAFQGQQFVTPEWMIDATRPAFAVHPHTIDLAKSRIAQTEFKRLDDPEGKVDPEEDLPNIDPSAGDSGSWAWVITGAVAAAAAGGAGYYWYTYMRPAAAGKQSDDALLVKV